MPKIQKSPTSTKSSEKQRVLPTSDVYGSRSESESETSNVSSRSKRLRPASSPEGVSTDSLSFEDRILNMLSTWKKEQDTILRKLTSDIAEVKQQNKEIKKSNKEIEKSIEYLSREYESMIQMVTKLEKESSEQRTYIRELENKINDIQRSFRSATIEIRNVPSNDKETSNDLATVVLETCKAVQVAVKVEELRDIYRLPGKQGQSRPIIAEFTTVPLKNKVLEATRAFNKGRTVSDKLNSGHIGINGHIQPIYLAEHLPISLRKLFHEARSFAKLYSYKFCWSQNGRILLRQSETSKTIHVHSLSCLQSLQKSADQQL